MGFFDRLKKGLTKTRENFTHSIERLIIGYADIDDDLIDELEETLLMADVGVKTTEMLIASVRKGIRNKDIQTPDDLIPFLEKEIVRILDRGESDTPMADCPPTVILVVGTNGVGKTTTIGKLSAYYRHQGKSVLLAAADTFRAAAIEQLEVWGKRADVQVIKHGEGSDPAAVVFDALQAAKARRTELVIVDTAGRLQTKSNLMQELEKIYRVIGRVVLTKLDGTAKGGVTIGITAQLDIPIKWIGVGEGIDDLRPFHAEDFVNALFAKREDA